MKGEYYLTDYILKENIKISKGFINLFNAPAGSGKTNFIFAENGLIYDTTKFINYEGCHPYANRKIPRKYNLSFNLDKILYICDTRMLKEKVLSKYSSITKGFDKNFFKDARDDDIVKKVLEKKGKIAVITYAQFGWIMGKKVLRNLIYDQFDLVIMDEFHNLFDYANKFDTEEKTTYGNIINNLGVLALNNLLVCLTATPYYANKGIVGQSDLKEELFNVILNDEQIKKIRQYEETWNKKEVYPINDIKWMCIDGKIDKIKNRKWKVLIYTTQIKTCNKYKEMLTNAGYKVEALWTQSKMDDSQKDLKQYLIEKEVYPDYLDVLIINKAYDTGWDLKDDRVQYVIIDSYNITIQTQVRNRCRHDIEMLTTKLYDEIEHYWNEKGQECYVEHHETSLVFSLNEEYLNAKLNNTVKKFLVDKYGSVNNKGSCNWKTFKIDLNNNGYITKTSNHGTYIYKKDDVEIIDEKVEVNKMNYGELLIDWIENQWDKSRITINDIKDILDIGTKTFNDLIKSKTIADYLKENRYTICVPKGTKTKYLRKY